MTQRCVRRAGSQRQLRQRSQSLNVGRPDEQRCYSGFAPRVEAVADAFPRTDERDLVDYGRYVRGELTADDERARRFEAGVPLLAETAAALIG
jgi:hypothetical protein